MTVCSNLTCFVPDPAHTPLKGLKLSGEGNGRKALVDGARVGGRAFQSCAFTYLAVLCLKSNDRHTTVTPPFRPLEAAQLKRPRRVPSKAGVLCFYAQLERLCP